MESFSNEHGYKPLLVNLEGYFEKPFSELPASLSAVVAEACFPSQWDALPEFQRRQIAAQYDYQNDPSHEPVLYWELVVLIDDLEGQIADAHNDKEHAKEVALMRLRERLIKIVKVDRSLGPRVVKHEDVEAEKLSRQRSRELVLAGWLSAHNLLDKEVTTKTRAELWEELGLADRRLFPPQQNETGLIKKFFDQQKLCTFKRGKPNRG